MSYQTSSKRSPPFCLLIGQKNTKVFWHQSEVRTASTIWNWSGKTLSPGALLTVLYFSLSYIFLPVQTLPRPLYVPLGLRGWYFSFCHRRYKIFMLFFQQRNVSSFFISRSRSLSPFISLSFAGLPPTVSFSLSFSGPIIIYIIPNLWT